MFILSENHVCIKIQMRIGVFYILRTFQPMCVLVVHLGAVRFREASATALIYDLVYLSRKQPSRMCAGVRVYVRVCVR